MEALFTPGGGTTLSKTLSALAVKFKASKALLFLLNDIGKLYRCNPSETKDEFLSFEGTLIDKALRTKTPVLMPRRYTILGLGDFSSIAILPLQEESSSRSLYGVVLLVNYTQEPTDHFPLVNLLVLLVRDQVNSARISRFYLEDKQMKGKDLFLASMSHEIRTPLNGIIGYLQLLLHSRLELQQRDYVLSMNRCSLALLSIINDILDYSKLMSGKIKLNPILVSLREIFDYVQETVKGLVRDKNHTLIISYDRELRLVIDRSKLIQIIINLVSNAIKFTPPNGEIKVSCSKEENTLLLTITDNGTGISPENQRHLFTNFTRFNEAETGTGLGLVITKKLVELFQGTITVESALGVGTTFTLSLKYSTPQISKPEVVKGRHLLLFAPTYGKELAFQLLEWGGIPSQASCIEESKKYLESNSFDLLITESSELAEFSKDTNHLLAVLSIGPFSPEVSYFDFHIDVPISQPQLIVALNKGLVERRGNSLKRNTKIKILIGEDDPDSARVLTKLLELLSYSQVTTAADGLEVLDRLQRERFDLLLLDLKMPKMDGYEVLENLQRGLLPASKSTDEHKVLSANSNDLKGLKIVPVSASNSEQDQAKCRSLGCRHFISKPVSMQELRDTLFRLFPS